MKRALLAFALLAALVTTGGAPRSAALFVASSDNAGSVFTAANSFNTVSITLTDPGTPLRGTVPLTASAVSNRSIVDVVFQYKRSSSSTWTTVCTDTAAAYTCDWSTTALTDTLYDLRATATDDLGYSQTATVTNRRVDNAAPDVTMNTPGSPMTGTRTITASASDTGGTGVTDVAFEYRTSPDGAWTPICTDATSSYSCSWNTSQRPDGLYDLRATATDSAGNTDTSIVSGRRLDNTAPTVVMDGSAQAQSGIVTLISTTGDGDGSGVDSVEYQILFGGSWVEACTGNTAPFSCTADTSDAPDGTYSMRAIAEDGAGFRTTSATVTTWIDNTAPSAAMTNPGSPLSGASVTLAGTGSDSGSGMASMRFEVRPSGGNWSTACTDAAPPSPFSCTWDSTTVNDGTYEFRAVATDLAGNTRTSTAVTNRIVDNNGPAVSVASPGSRVRGTRTVTAAATDVSGVTSVEIQYAAAGSGSFTTICTDLTSASWTCAWNTTALADGPYELRAIATDSLGRSTTSAVATTAVDTLSPSGVDVQGANGGTNDRLDSGDSITFTYSAAMLPGTIFGGWAGTSTAMTVRVNNSGGQDTMEFYNAANNTPLAGLLASGTTLALNGDYISSSTARFDATIAQTGAAVTVTIGARQNGTVRNTATGSTAMVWQPSEAATDAGGRFCMPIAVTETGSPDVDL